MQAVREIPLRESPAQTSSNYPLRHRARSESRHSPRCHIRARFNPVCRHFSRAVADAGRVNHPAGVLRLRPGLRPTARPTSACASRCEIPPMSSYSATQPPCCKPQRSAATSNLRHERSYTGNNSSLMRPRISGCNREQKSTLHPLMMDSIFLDNNRKMRKNHFKRSSEVNSNKSKIKSYVARMDNRWI